MFFSNKIRIFGIIIGVLMLGGLVGVMALTVQRAQQLQSTIGRPKAASGEGWPACAYNRSQKYWCTDADCKGSGDHNMEQCCAKMGAGGTWTDCAWPARGWCNASQCDGTIPDESQPPGSKKGRCGLYYYNEPNCTKTSPPPANTYVCTNPTGGREVPSLTPTLYWDYSVVGVTYQNAYITTSSTCSYELGPVQWFDNVPLSSKQVTAATLQPNTTYYWNVYGNGTNGIQGCGCASFKTPAAPPPPPECTADSACAADKKCESNKCVAISCTTADVCKTATVANHVCTIANKTDGTTCETGGKTCQSGVCTSPSCPTGQTLCGTVCKNLQTDNSNCGACGNVCSAGQTCTNGVCVTPAECTIDANCAADKKCESNKCVAISCTTTDVCKTATIANHACVIANKDDGTTCETGGKTCQSGVCNSSEVNVCWGNLGAGTNAGRCYDCNGDGVINILDFSCFAKRWREKVE